LKNRSFSVENKANCHNYEYNLKECSDTVDSEKDGAIASQLNSHLPQKHFNSKSTVISDIECHSFKSFKETVRRELRSFCYK